MWIVMTSSAAMPSSCKGHYRNVALVELKCSWDYPEHNRPSRIDSRDRKIARVRHWGAHNVGKTDRCAYKRTLARAERLAQELNDAQDEDGVAEVWATWGGSA